jgi:hypothetical protein
LIQNPASTPQSVATLTPASARPSIAASTPTSNSQPVTALTQSAVVASTPQSVPSQNPTSTQQPISSAGTASPPSSIADSAVPERETISITLNEEALELLPEKALFWKTKSMLVLSDVHLGKAESFQAMGVPMPSGSHWDDLNELSRLIHQHSPQTVLILGDFIHQKSSWTDDLMNDLLDFFSGHSRIEWILVLGNHERGSQNFLNTLPLKLVTEQLFIEPFIFSHGHHLATPEPTAKKRKVKPKDVPFSIQGHIHPAVRLREGSTTMKLPAFFITGHTLLLPAFGSQTGGYELKYTAKDRVFPTTGKLIFELK